MPGRQKKPTLRSQPLPRQEVNVTIQHLPEEQHQQQHQQQQQQPQPQPHHQHPVRIAAVLPHVPGLHPFYLLLHSQMIRLTAAALAHKPAPTSTFFRCQCCMSSHRLEIDNGQIKSSILETPPLEENRLPLDQEDGEAHQSGNFDSSTWELLENFLEENFPGLFQTNNEDLEGGEQPSSST
jgi:hypothetical protein